MPSSPARRQRRLHDGTTKHPLDMVRDPAFRRSLRDPVTPDESTAEDQDEFLKREEQRLR